MNTRRVWVTLAVIVLLLGAACLLLNFRAATSNTQADKNITTTSIGDGLPDAVRRRDKISIAVVGEGPLVQALQAALTRQMDDAGIAPCELVQPYEPPYQNPILVITVAKPDLIWTPFFATSRLSVEAGYTSNGLPPFAEETTLTDDGQSGSALQISAEYSVTDRSWGLISRPGYHALLADCLAQQIVVMLKDLYQA